MSRYLKYIFFTLAFAILGTGQAMAASAASMSLYPPSGSYAVGSTFTASVILDTDDQFINAVDATLSFPPDKLQVVAPSLGTSIVNVWTNQPSFNNQTGLLRFQGGIPDPGIKTSRGVIATVTFRVKSVGQALIKFLDESKVLLNDGLGTNVLKNTGNAIFDLALPPPRGPVVISETHPDQSRWYQGTSPVLRWTNNIPIAGYSYVLNSDPIDIPDNISEGAQTNVIYKGLADGIYFFHIKALLGGSWGETSHFAIKIDSGAPAEFPIDISPSSYTSNHQPLIYFSTTDTLSGIDHYEIKIVTISKPVPELNPKKEPFFIEAHSPYVPSLDLGAYQVIIRAYDKAGNIREVAQKLSVVTPIVRILGMDILPRWLSVIVGIILVLALGYAALLIWQWHRRIELRRLLGAIKDPEIAGKLKALREKGSRYLKNFFIFLLLLTAVSFGISKAQAETGVVPAPIVTTISKNISNEEVFYIGGKVPVPSSDVIVYLQNLRDGETLSATVSSDKKGDWFYSHPQFLSPGHYLVWTQLKTGQITGAPSPQYEIGVIQTAIQFGASRISLETLYLIFIFLLLVAVIGTSTFILYHFYHGRRKEKKLMKEILEAEEAIKKGFLLLRRDLQEELAVINKNKLNSKLSAEDLEKEQRLMKDLEWVNKFIEKEVMDIERLLGNQ